MLLSLIPLYALLLICSVNRIDDRKCGGAAVTVVGALGRPTVEQSLDLGQALAYVIAWLSSAPFAPALSRIFSSEYRFHFLIFSNNFYWKIKIIFTAFLLSNNFTASFYHDPLNFSSCDEPGTSSGQAISCTPCIPLFVLHPRFFQTFFSFLHWLLLPCVSLFATGQ